MFSEGSVLYPCITSTDQCSGNTLRLVLHTLSPTPRHVRRLSATNAPAATARFAEKNGLPRLERVSLPRVGAARAVLDLRGTGAAPEADDKRPNGHGPPAAAAAAEPVAQQKTPAAGTTAASGGQGEWEGV